MLHRLRKAYEAGSFSFQGPVEVDESYFGGKEKNKHANKKMNAGRGPVGKTAVVGALDRATNSVSAQVIEKTDGQTLNAFVDDHAAEGANVYTDDASAYRGRHNHAYVRHSVGEYVREQVHTNGVESFWALLKRGYHGTYHHMSKKHLQRYVDEFAGRHNTRDLNTVEQMGMLIAGGKGKELRYRDLVG